MKRAGLTGGRPMRWPSGFAALAFAACALMGCPASSQSSQTADGSAAQETALSYAEIRAVFAEDYVIGSNGKFKSPAVEEKFVNFDGTFRGCTYGSPSYNSAFGIGGSPETMTDSGEFEELPPESDELLVDTVEDTAIIDVQLTSYLRRLGIPARIYEKPLQKWVAASRSGDPEAYETVPYRFDYRFKNMPIYETEIAKLDGELIDGINANIDKAHLQKRVRLSPNEGCGAGDVPYRIQTTPDNSVVSVIQTSFFKLCRVRKIDPYDTSRCDGWKDLRDGQMVFMAGDYQWSIKPKGAAEKRGKISLFGGGTEEIDDAIPLKIGD